MVLHNESKDTIINIILKHSDYQPRRVWLFGSHARAEEREDSDIDIGIEYRTISDYDAQRIQGNLRRKLSNYNVDVHILNTSRWDVCLNCGAEGIVIYDSMVTPIN